MVSVSVLESLSYFSAAHSPPHVIPTSHPTLSPLPTPRHRVPEGKGEVHGSLVVLYDTCPPSSRTNNESTHSRLFKGCKRLGVPRKDVSLLIRISYLLLPGPLFFTDR